jgi:hypothetical protein
MIIIIDHVEEIRPVGVARETKSIFNPISQRDIDLIQLKFRD